MAISFILLTLANQPHAQTRVFDEILQVVGPTNHPTFHDLQALRYTERCIKECLRLFPSVPFISRRAGEDFRTTTGYDQHHRKSRPDDVKYESSRVVMMSFSAYRQGRLSGLVQIIEQTPNLKNSLLLHILIKHNNN
jgi:hypothetical protein